MGAQKTGMDQVPYRCLNHGSRNIPISRCPKMGVPPHHDLINHLNVLKLQLFLGTSHFKKASSKLTKNPWENHHVSISMAIFNSHVSLPEGNARFFIAMFDYRRVEGR